MFWKTFAAVKLELLNTISVMHITHLLLYILIVEGLWSDPGTSLDNVFPPDDLRFASDTNTNYVVALALVAKHW